MIVAIARKSRVGMDPKNKASANTLIIDAMAGTNHSRDLEACYFINLSCSVAKKTTR